MSNEHAIDVARAEALQALPATLSLIRWLVMASLEAGDPEGDELRRLLEACVVGAHRVGLRERLRSQDAWVKS